MSNDRESRQTDENAGVDEHVPDAPPVREEYPGPQETTTGERIDPGSTEARPDSPEERRGRRQGAS